MLEAQLFGQKWFLENIKCDKHEVTVVPEFLFVEDPSSLGAEIEFSDDDIPWIKRPHLLQREEDLKTLKLRLKEHDLPEESFEWYLDLRRFGSVVHSGFGLGLERTIAWICKLPHLRETISFPRLLERVYP